MGIRHRGAVTALVVTASLVGGASPAHASSFVFGDLFVQNLSISAVNGTVNFAPYSSSAFAQAQNSLGQLDAQFDGPGAAASATAVVNDSLSDVHAVGNSGAARWQATSAVLLSSGVDETGAAEGQGLWSRDFSIACPTLSCGASTQVNFSALFSQQLSVQTDGVGLLAQAELIFNLNVDGDPALFYHALLFTGPNGLQSQNGQFTLSNALTLNYDTPYSLFLRVDSESNGHTALPEPSTFALFALGMGAVGLRRRRALARSSSH